MIKQLLNSVIAKYRDLSVYVSQINYLPQPICSPDKSRYFAQPRPTIVNYFPKELNVSEE